MKGRKNKSERIVKTCGAALAVSLAVANVNYAVCEVGASAQAGRVIQSSVSKKQHAALTVTPTPSVTPLLKLSPTPAATAVPTAAPVVTSAPVVTAQPEPQTPAYTPVPEPTQAPLVTEAPAPTSVPESNDVPEAVPSQTPSASETPAPEGSITPSASETPAPEGSMAPSASETPAPEGSIAPSASETPVPEGSITPSASETPAAEGSITPSVSGTPAPGTFETDGQGTAGDAYWTEPSQTGQDAPTGDDASGDVTADGTEIQNPEDEPDVPDVSFAGSEELVGFTTFAGAKKTKNQTAAVAEAKLEPMVAGSSPLVGGEIADNVYRENTPKATVTPKAKAAATAAPTETPVSDWSTEMTDSLSSNKEKDPTPVLGEPDEKEKDSADEATAVPTSRFGVLTGDTTDIFSYVAVGLSSIVVAFLTFFTMCARGRKRPEEERPEK